MRNEMPPMALAALLTVFSVGAAGQTGQTLKGADVLRMATITFAAAGQNPASAKATSPEGADQGEPIYRTGMQALNNQQWQTAITNFSRLAHLHGKRGDEALYWEAYAEDKQDQLADALTTLKKLETAYPRSRWLNDARALELQVRQASGQAVSPEDQPDEQLKLLAINALMNSNPDRAIPLLEKLINGNQPADLKERALFVLTQSRSPQAQQAVVRVAQSSPDLALRKKALNDLALFGGEQTRQVLAGIYASSSDLAVKQHILHDFMLSGAQDQLLEIAKTDKVPELRKAAIKQLALAGGGNQLATLYRQETDQGIKKVILHSMFLSHNSKALTEIARTETNPQLRVEAIHSLGLIRDQQSGDTLASLYTANPDSATREAVLNALFIQGNAHALVGLARKETNPEMKKAIVGKLSLMHSKEGTDYLLELLNH